MNNVQIKDREIYLIVNADKELMKRLSIKQWNDLIDRYTNDDKSLVTPYNKEQDGMFFVTTTLKNVLENQSIYDLRFLSDYRTKWHLTFNK